MDQHSDCNNIFEGSGKCENDRGQGPTAHGHLNGIKQQKQSMPSCSNLVVEKSRHWMKYE